MAFGDADASTPSFVKANVAGKNVTTGSFTPPAGALLVAFAFHDTAGGNVTNTSVVTSSDGAAGTGVTGAGWAIRATVSKQSDGVGFANGHLQISTAVVSSSVAMTVTTTGTNTNNPAGLYVRVITGADTTTPMDATPVEGTNTNAVISVAITTATAGARAFLAATDWNLAANMAAGTAQTAVVADGIGAPDMRVYVGVQNAVTSPAGAVTSSTVSPVTGNTNNYATIAVRPAAGGSTVTGTGVAALGALAGTAAGKRTVLGTAAKNLGALAATATGARTVQGAASAILDGLTGTVAGRRTVLGTGAAPLGRLVGTAVVGAATVTGIGSAAPGGLRATAVVHGATTLAGGVHGPQASTPGAVTVHTVSIAGVIT